MWAELEPSPLSHKGQPAASPPCAQQDMVVPVMYSPNKYHASPFLGAPARERKYLAVFKGAAAGACLSRRGCTSAVSIAVWGERVP